VVKGGIVKKAVVLPVIGILVIAVFLAYWYYFHSYKPTLARKQLVEKFSKIKTWYLKLKTEEYNVTEAEYWVVKAKQAFDRGDYEEANKLLDKALKALEKAEKYSLPIFPVVKSNSWITDPVTLYDFVPFGVALIKLPDNRLTISRGEGWTASNFVQFGMCTDGENILVFHSSVNIGGGSLRLMFNGKRIFGKLSGPSYYDKSGKYFPYPTVHTNPSEDYVIAIAYDEETRTWYHKIVYTKTSPPTEILYVKGKGRLSPLWVGKPEGPFVVHGIAGVKQGKLYLDTWGGYLDFEELVECRYHDLETGKTYTFASGFAFMDREYHRLLPVGSVEIREGKIVDGIEFDAMSFHKIEGEEIEFIFILAKNPLPENIKEEIEFPEFEHFGRINFVDRGKSYRFDDFEFRTDGRLQPLKYYLRGNFTDDGRIVGSVNLTAEAFAFWGYGGAENWKVHRVWWDPGGAAAWGRSFVKWSGTITIGNEVIEVRDVLGFGEFHRYKSRYYSKLREDTLQKPSKVRVVVEYTSVTSGIYYLNRSINDVINILKDLDADWIYLGWRYRLPAPESPYEEPGFFTKEQIEEASRRGYTFSQLKKAIDEIHREISGVLFTGGLGMEFFYARDRDPITGEIIDREKAWSMAFDPQEHNLSISKEEFQCWHAKRVRWLPENFDCSKYDYRMVKGYWSDINKEEVRLFYLHKAMKLIDCGVDVVWIDQLLKQAHLIYSITGDIKHPAIEETFKSVSKLVDEIHAYGLSKGKYVYVGSWAPIFKIGENLIIPPYKPPDYDYVVLSPGSREVLNMKLHEEEWRILLSNIKDYMGEDTVILVRLDLGSLHSPIHVFSQYLNSSQQRKFLVYLDNFLRENGVLFSYPVFGLYMGPWEENEAKIFSWREICWVNVFGEERSRFPEYDSLAPEFQTYETIRELAQSRRGERRE